MSDVCFKRQWSLKIFAFVNCQLTHLVLLLCKSSPPLPWWSLLLARRLFCLQTTPCFHQHVRFYDDNVQHRNNPLAFSTRLSILWPGEEIRLQYRKQLFIMSQVTQARKIDVLIHTLVLRLLYSRNTTNLRDKCSYSEN